MRASYFLEVLSLACSLLTPAVHAQTQDAFTDSKTNITFWRTSVQPELTQGGLQIGLALPGLTSANDDEYIGMIVGALHNDTGGWTGISHGGGMPNALLLMAWPDGDKIRTSFRYASGYNAPDIYTGNATLTQISHTINATHFTLIYRCQWCWYWDQNGATGSQPPSKDTQVIGWAANMESPADVSNSAASITEHDNGQAEYGAPVASARNAAYTSWVAQYGGNGTTGNGTSPTPTASATPTAATTCVGTPAPAGTWDYIVVGSGAGGIPLADKLSESGASVLLIEKGPPSSGRWGGTMKPAWLDGTNLTRFDVPGLCNEIWADSAGIGCTDMDQMAGCVLGGGTAVNAALWWNPNPVDWDYNMPAGWKSADMAPAAKRVFERLPGTYTPSADGVLYMPQGYNLISSALALDGWKHVVANDVPGQKHQTYSHSPYMYQHGERAGPMATYLVTASQRKNFKLWMNTMVRRVIRTNGHITGVELDTGTTGNGSYCGIVNVTAGTGRVILSAGAFGSPKILFRSGIGPKDQLQVVAGSMQDGKTMINSSQWINLPVGQNLNDHVNTDLVVRHPNVTFYDFYAAYNTPIEADKDAYLGNRTRILTQSAPNIGPMFWDEINGTDGINRAIQWQARVEPSPPATDNTSLTISQYLGRGTTSRGVTSINGALNMYVSQVPYLRTQEDIDAVVQGIENLQKAIAKIPSIVWEVPTFQNITARDWVKSLRVSTSNRRSNHWIGTAKMGTDSGLTGGTAVVDTNTKVYGTDNLFVVDASIFPGHITTNPSAYIVTVAEQAATKILALKAATGSTGSTGSASVAAYGQCGGSGFTGSTTCVSGYKCKSQNAYYSQCIPA